LKETLTFATRNENGMREKEKEEKIREWKRRD
jgi:hypothetical protein